MTEVTSELRVHMRHVRAAKLCSRGAREWFQHYGLDWNEFLDSGLPISVIEGTGDPFGQQAADQARAEADGER